jgi:hypothetical protein
MGKSKTELEWVIYRTSQIPAPGVYEVEARIPNGGKFNMVRDKRLLQTAGTNASVHAPTDLIPVFVPAGKPEDPSRLLDHGSAKDAGTGALLQAHRRRQGRYGR